MELYRLTAASKIPAPMTLPRMTAYLLIPGGTLCHALPIRNVF